MLHFRNENVEKSMFYNIQYGNACPSLYPMFIDTRACILSVYGWYSKWAIRGLLRFRNFSFESESSFSCNCTGNLYRLRDVSSLKSGQIGLRCLIPHLLRVFHQQSYTYRRYCQLYAFKSLTTFLSEFPPSVRIIVF